MHTDETIVAIASAHTGSYRGIVRVSGTAMIQCVKSVFRGEVDPETLARAERVPGSVSLDSPLGDVPCDLYLWPNQQSYTRQPTAELHTYGALPLLNAIISALCHAGARLARPGEFTLRAFLAGRLDLAQAEAVLGVIDAVDKKQLGVALTQLAGGLSQPLMQLRNDLLNLCADLEAGLDFVEEDITFISKAQSIARLTRAVQQIDVVLEQMSERDTGDVIPRVVLRGKPNVGKSSLWNAVMQDGRAIVTAIAGTTRDYLTGTVRTGDILFTLIDTAGVDSTAHTSIDADALAKAEQQSQQADLLILCFDATRSLDEWERAELERTSHLNRILVLTKCDSHSVNTDLAPDVETSVAEMRGMEELIQKCGERLQGLQGESTVVASTAIRCRESLRLARSAVDAANTLAAEEAGDELVAAELRNSLDHLGEVVGAVYTDDVLDRVFSRFCIGK